MKLTHFSVRNYQFTIVFFLLLVAIGWTSLRSIPRTEDPQLSFPSYNVVVVNPGANPADLERLIARPLEDAIKELDDVTKLQTTIRDGVVAVAAEFKYGIDTDRKYDDVLRQVNQVRPTLPAGITYFDTRHDQTSHLAIMQLAFVSPDASFARMQDAAETLRKRLEAVPGVRKAEKWAYPDKQVRITLDLDKVAQLHLPVSRIIEAINAANINLPGGAVEVGGRRFTVKTSGSYTSLDEVKDTPVTGNGSVAVRLRDIADVRWDYEDQEHIGRFKGERAVFVTVQAQQGRSVFAVTEGLHAALDQFRPTLPGDIRLAVGFEQAQNIDRRLGRLRNDLLIAIALVMLTVAPLGWRAALLVTLSIPLSLAMGVAALEAAGHTLNQLSIVGFVIALGLLVDDSIVVVENIARFRRAGYPPQEAAIQATNQISVAVLGTTATLLFAFLPLLMLPGGPGLFIRTLPLAVEFTVLASLVVALTIIPFLASRVLTGREESEGNALLRALTRVIHTTYRPLLHWVMQHRGKTLLGAALLFAGSLALVPVIGFSLFPKAGTPQFLIKFEAPEGASLAANDRIARQIEDALRTTPEIDWWFTNVGHGNPFIYYNVPPAEQKPNVGEIYAQVKPALASDSRTPVILARLRQRLEGIPGAQILVREFENGPPIEAPIAVRIFGDDLDELARLAARAEEVLRQTKGSENVNNPVRTRRTDLRVRIDRPAAALLGVPDAEIDRAVRLALAGLNVARYREDDGDEYNIQLALPRGDRADLTQWQKISVQTASGAFVPLAQVASLEFDSAPAVILRYLRERCVTVTSFVQDGVNVDKATQAVDAALRRLDWPSGYRYEFGGEVESRKQSFGGLGTAIVIAVFGILAILVLEFRSFRGTFIVASVIPLGVIGGLVALWLTGNSLSFTAVVGFVALVGIEIKNSILLVDFTNQLRARGVPLREAIEQAGEIRFLPIVLTTLTALGALLPLAVQGAGLYSPLAIVIIGGLLSSLLLSRLVTPVLYSLLPPPGPEDGAAEPASAAAHQPV
ncbi:MAG: efflux RND transporter permease subunit [Opitutae bacterium]|nr:efflux RND transporter permease subunit [Opitutae bacterium]